MGKILAAMKKYLSETPKEVIKEDLKEIENLNCGGPDMMEFIKYMETFHHVNSDNRVMNKNNESES